MCILCSYEERMVSKTTMTEDGNTYMLKSDKEQSI
jgi:hypothetical protein